MITDIEKQAIKKLIGHRYVSLIQTELNDSDEFNKSGGSYSSGHITNVMNGEKHDVIEAAIYRVVEKKHKEIEARKSLINKKSAAVTADS
ncbi:hypothetical protein [Lacinutrix sp. Hel_I_90]|uniref:hypothetical protein n=1 Tax=Lacinutrix sp. Hel_I_90 TaxID=1249999 RepID=UPI0005CB0625|nr:hypothetical protein [Lacinutrix sp. Hel_I_90]